MRRNATEMPIHPPVVAGIAFNYLQALFPVLFGLREVVLVDVRGQRALRVFPDPSMGRVEAGGGRASAPASARLGLPRAR